MGERLNRPPETVPYLASFRWYSLFFKALVEGKEEYEARVYSNRVLNVGKKDFSRSKVGKGQRLTIPLEGRASSCVSPLTEKTISGHGNWRHTHRGALDALFGRTPYYPHLMPRFAESLQEYGEPGMSLARLTEQIHEKTADFIGLREASRLYHTLPPEKRDLLRRRGEELSGAVMADESLASVIMRLGPDAIFPLIATLTQEKTEEA